jgi:hypothetical protein
MNYYSIEFFKHYLSVLKNSTKDKSSLKTIKIMQNFVKDREENNKDAYSIKWMSKPIFT